MGRLVKHERRGEVLVLQVNGELDLKGAQELRTHAEKLLGEGRTRRLVLDLTGVGFIDSSGLSAILGRYRHLHELGGRMAVCGASARVTALLEMAGVSRFIPLCASLAEALACVKEPPA